MWFLVPVAIAGEWSSRPVEPRYETDFTAYTVPQKHLRAGIVSLDYGLLENASLGTTPLLYVFGVPNLRAKVTAIRSPKFDASVQAAVAWRDFDGIVVTSWPIQANASWIVTPRFSLHGGGRWENVTLSGEATLDELGTAAAALLGTDLGPELDEALSSSGALYAGAHLSLVQGQLAADWRFNRRDSLILQWKGWLHLRARVDAGYETESEDVRVGVTTQLDRPLDDEAIGVTTLSWQFSWEHLHLRLGLGIPGQGYGGAGLLAVIEQSAEVYWLF